MSTSSAGTHAYNPGVLLNGVPLAVRAARSVQQQAYLVAIADQAEAAIQVIEDRIAGLEEALKAAKAEAKRARAEAQEEES
jgi:hypothetical protein